MSDPQWLRDARKRGLTISEGPVAAAPREPVKLCVATFRPSLACPTWEIPLETRAEANKRSWQLKSKRSNKAWAAVSRAFGPHLAYLVRFASDYHAGLPVRVTFTRLGGRRLDPLVNLPSSLKGVEDATAYFLGASDGAANWRPSCDQEPECDGMGVRIAFHAPN